MKNQSRCFSLDISGRVDVLQARYAGRAFSSHWHEEYAVGLITAGVEQFDYRGRRFHAGRGEVVLLDAGEVHNGEAWDDRGFAFRMLYIPESTFREVAEGFRRPLGTLHFRHTVLSDALLSRRLSRLHGAFNRPRTLMETETLFLDVASGILERAGSWRGRAVYAPAELPIRRARDYLLQHLFAEVSLERLAQVSGMSKFHLVRQFRVRFGLPPHAYQLQQRILRSKSMLRRMPPADVAALCGFADQSHFHRVFRSLVGTTPGCYAEPTQLQARTEA